MAAGKSRYQMIIDVALQGDASMQKLASKAKKAAIDVQGLNVAIKASGVNLQKAKTHMEKWGKDLGQLEKDVKSTNKAKFQMIAAEKNLTKAMQTSAKSISDYNKKVSSSTSAITRQRKALTSTKVQHLELKDAVKLSADKLKDLNVALAVNTGATKRNKDLKTKVLAQEKKHNALLKDSIGLGDSVDQKKKALARSEAALTKAKTDLNKAQSKEIVDRGKLEAKVDRATESYKAEDAALKKLQASVHKGVKGIVTRNEKTKEWTINEKKLKAAVTASKEGLTQLSAGIKKQSKESSSASKGTKRHRKSIEGLGFAAKRTNKHFRDWHDQRIGQNGGITIFRQSLGALRNQLLVLAFATRGLRNIFNKAFEATKQMESALRGLSSVAMNTGAGMRNATEAAKELAESGLMTISEAAAGLKNLLSAGFGMPEAVKMMNVLTDAAAFNRQGTLAMGEAIVGATQGIKNQNSIMVDNAGITKNLSVMYKEYATAIGTTMGKLDEAQKRQAIYNGILKEGAIFAGDQLKVLATMEGSLAKYKVAVFNAAAALGDVLKPAVQGIVKAMGSAVEAVNEFFADPEKKREFMLGMASAGKDLGDAISFLAGVFGFMAKTMLLVMKYIPQLIHFFVAYKIVTKVILKLGKANISMMTALKERMIQYRIQVKSVEIGVRKLADGTKQLQFSQNKIYTSHGKQLIGWKKYKFELDRILLTYDKMLKKGKPVIVQGKWMTRVFGKQLSPEMARATQKMRAFGLAAQRAGGKLKVLSMGLKSVGVALKSMLFYFLAFEAALLLFRLLSDAITGRKGKELAQATAAMSRNIKKLQQTHKSAMEGIAKTKERVGYLGFDQKSIKFEQAALEDHLLNIRGMVRKHNRELNEKKRQSLADTISIMEEDYQLQFEQLGNAHRALLAEETKFNEKLTQIAQGFEKGMEAYYQSSGLKALKAAKESIKLQQEAAEWWKGQKAIIEETSITEAQVIQNKLDTWELYNAERHAIALAKITADFHKQEMTIQKRLDALKIRQNNTTQDMIVTKYKNINTDILGKIKVLEEGMETDGLKKIQLARQTSDAVANEMKTAIDHILKMRQTGETVFKDATQMLLTLTDKEDEAYKKRMNMGDLFNKASLKVSKEGGTELGRAFELWKGWAAATNEAMDNMNTSADVAEKAFKSFQDQIGEVGAMDEGEDKIKATTETLDIFREKLVAIKSNLKDLGKDTGINKWSKENRAKFYLQMQTIDLYLSKIDAWKLGEKELAEELLKQGVIVDANVVKIAGLTKELDLTAPAAEKAELATLWLNIGMKNLNAQMKVNIIKDRAKAMERLADATDELHKITVDLQKSLGTRGLFMWKMTAVKIKETRDAIKGTTQAHKDWVTIASGGETDNVTAAKLRLVDAEILLQRAQEAALPTMASARTAIVEKGQSLSQLAGLYDTTIEKLKEWNQAVLMRRGSPTEGFNIGAEIQVGEAGGDPGVTAALVGVGAAKQTLQDLMATLPSAAQAWTTYTTAVTHNNQELQKNINSMRVLPAMFEGPLGTGIQLSALYQDQAVKMAMMESAHQHANQTMLDNQTNAKFELEGLKARKVAYVTMMTAAGDWIEKDAEITDQNLINLNNKIGQQDLEFSLIDARIEKLGEEQRAELENARNDDAKEAFMAKVAAWQKGISVFSSLLGGLIKAHQDIANEEEKYRTTLKNEVNDYDDWDTKRKLLEANKQKVFDAKRDLANSKALASLAKVIIIEISLYAARELAKVGGIAGAVMAMSMIAAGQIAGAAAERSIIGDAQRTYDTAVAEAASSEKKMRAQWDDELRGGEDAEEVDVGARQLGGTIKAEQLSVSISPTIVISGEQIFIGQGSVTEFSMELRALLIDSAQQAIETGEIDITPLGGSGLLG